MNRYIKSINNSIGLVLYYAFAQFLPKSSTPIIGRFCRYFRSLIALLIFKKTGKGINLENKAYFGSGKNIVIGDYSGIGKSCRIPNNIIIGKYVMMAEDVVILCNNHMFESTQIPMIFQGIGEKTALLIEDDVWLGTRVVILPSVKIIGKGSIIGAGTIVTKDVPRYSIVAGNPGRVIGNRK